MSAYICQPEAFGLLGAYAVINDCIIYDWEDRKAKKLLNAQRVARGLASENVRSVSHRYPNDLDDLPGPGLKIPDIYEAASIYAAHFLVNPGYVNSLSPIQIWKLAQGMDYQSCECDDYNNTLAWRQLDWIKNQAVRTMKGYEAADWAYERKIPEIEALYDHI